MFYKEKSKNSPIRVMVDGIVYGFQKHGGINVYFNEVLPRLGMRDDTVVYAFLPSVCGGTPPSLPVRSVHRDYFPSRTGLSWRLDEFAEPIIKKINFEIMGLRIQARERRVFVSTYFTWISDSVPQVGIVHDMNHELFPEFYQDEFGSWLRRQYREYLGHATRIIAVSQKTKDDVTRLYDIDPSVIDVVHHATDREKFWPERSPESGKLLQTETGLNSPYILYVGGRQSYKNFDGLLAGFAQSCIKGKTKLIVAGLPWNRRQLQLIHDRGLDSYVQLVVNPSDTLLRALYSFAAAFVFPSYNEGFGIPLLEAMACGTLVLCSDTEVFHEVAGDAAVFFDPYDPMDISKVLEVSLDEDIRKEYIARGFEQVDKYSWDKCAEQTMSIYKKAMASKGY